MSENNPAAAENTAFDLILKNGTVATPAGLIETDIAVVNGKIAGLGDFGHKPAKETIDCGGLHILPGVIDSHVHFREPGLTHKEDLSTGSLAAAFGGVTTIFEMPNTDPLTITARTHQEKLLLAHGHTFCDHAFFIGGCDGNAHYLHALERLPGCSGVKVFMGSSTGALLAAEDETLLKIFKNGSRRIALHAEDEARLISRKNIAEQSGDVHDHPNWRDAECALLAVKRAVKLGREAGRRLQFLHTTSADEMAFLKDYKDIATVETTPQHLTLFAPDCYDRLGTRAQMNPPIRSKAHQDMLWQAINNGIVDNLGSDHAPHTLDEKAKSYPASPSGMPGVQTMLPVMLTHVANGKLSLLRLVDLLCHGPQRVYQINNKGRIAAGYDADFAIVDLKTERTITDRWIKSKCGWTPFDGFKTKGWVIGTLLRGKVIVWEDDVPATIAAQPPGKPVRFAENLIESTIKDEAEIVPPKLACCT
ncbi:MAG TPA: dihydroorotase [Alphaproteobacteria bacterium]|nr:dihydroorotase [Alphaproteobacteria bacterium]